MACWRTGAVVAPLVPAAGRGERERVRERLNVAVVITVGTWQGNEFGAELAEMAPSLPHLRHRVVVGGPGRDGEADFAHYFGRPWPAHPMRLDDADEDRTSSLTSSVSA